MSITDQLSENEVVQSPLTRFFAHVLSYLFHPLFIPVYVTYFIAFIHPDYFSGFSLQQKIWLLIRVSYSMVFFPAITVLLLNATGYIGYDPVFLCFKKNRINKAKRL